MFKYDNPMIEIIGKIADVVLLGIIWFIMCIPIITIGASTTAAYYVAFEELNNKDGYVVKKFFKSFTQNFKQATIVFLVLSLFISIAAVNLFLLNTGVIVFINGIGSVIIVAQICVIMEVMLTCLFAFSLLSKFTFTTKQLFISAFQLGNKHLFTGLLNFVLVALVGLLVVTTPIILIASGGIYIFLSAFLLKRVFKKYRPEAFENLGVVENDDYKFKIKNDEHTSMLDNENSNKKM